MQIPHKTNNKYKHILPIALFLAIALLSIFWIPHDMIAYFHDENIPLNPKGSLVEYFYVWRESINFGFATAGGVQKLLPFSVFYIFDFLGLGIRTTEIFLYILMLATAGISMYFLLTKIGVFMEEKKNKIFATIGGLFYILSPFPIFYIWRTNYIITRGWFYAFAPLLLLSAVVFCINRFRGKNVGIPLLGLGLSGILITPSFSHPSFPIILALLLVFVFLILTINNKDMLKSTIASYMLMGVALLSLNMYWLIPRLYTAASELEGAASVGLRSSFERNSAALSLNDNFMLSQTPPLYEPMQWFAWQNYYVSIPFIVLSLALAVVMFSTLLKPTKTVLITVTAYLMFWPLMIGLQKPFGWLSGYIFDNLAIMQSFRDPGKWGFILIFFLCILMGIGFTRLIYRFPRYKIVTISFLVVALVGLGWPILAGKVLPDKNDFPSAKISIPPDYYELSDKLKGNEGPILQLPFHGVHNYAKWDENNGYKGIDILRMRSSQPLVSYYQDPQFNELLKTLEFNVKNNKFKESQLQLLLLNINSDKVVINKDSDNNFVKSSVSSQEYIKLLDSFHFLEKKFESKNLIMYKVKSETEKTKITLTNNLKQDNTIIPKSLSIMQKTSWHAAQHLVGKVKKSVNDSLILTKKNGSVDQNYTYIRNDNDLSINPNEFQYIKVVSNAKPSEYSLLLSGESVGEESSWLESLGQPKVDKEMPGSYIRYFSTAQFNTTIKTLRLTVMAKKPLMDINVGINGIDASDSLFNDYGKLTTNNINQTTYNDQGLSIESGKSKLVSYEQVNPAKYTVSLNVDKSTVLSLKQSFDKNWKIKVLKDEGDNSIRVEDHFKGDGFYNSWILKNTTGKSHFVSLEITYAPQNLFVVSFFITTASFILIIISSLYIYFKKRAFVK